ncbi:MAG TPA: hypothetical protein VHG28_06835 [Longimicrobiaceae bacterium]|nr:hypothetical protein [Longimicrobiaceae bacterium]
MRIHPTNPELYLVELTDLQLDPLPERVRADYALLVGTMGWAVSYLTNPHPELGRSGPVCPFTRPAMRKNTFFLTVYHGSDLRQEDVLAVIREYRDWFLEMDPREGKDVQYKTVNILFPDISTEDAIELIEATQTRLKPEYVPHGIMIGEFHPGPPKKAGLWNPDFRPLKSPVPLMSIRYMVPTDFAFLRDTREFMTAYLTRFADRLPVPMRSDIEETARRFGLESLLEGLSPAEVKIEIPPATLQELAAGETLPVVE